MIRPSPDAFNSERLRRFDRGWTRRTLPNGMTAVHVPTPDDDRFYLGVTIRAGARLETPEQAGISHFLEHMMFRGSALYPEFTQLAEAFEWLGGDWNAATGHEHTEYWYAGIRHTAHEVVPLFADFLENPVLADIEVERNVILRELDGEMNDHGHYTDLDYQAARLLWPGSSLALPILGTRDTIAAVDVPALRAWRDQWYTPRNMTVCAVGGDPSVLDAVARAFGSHRAGHSGAGANGFPPFTAHVGPSVRWVEHSDNEYELRLAFPCAGEWSPDAPALDLIARILSDGFCSRLNKRLREELGLVYDVFVDADLMLEAGSVHVGASCAKDQLDPFLAETFRLLAEFAARGPSEDELRRAALRSIVELELTPGNAEALSTRLAWGILCGRERTLEDERARILAVTTADVARVARALFRPAGCALVALGPPDRDIEKRLRKAIMQGFAG